MKTLIALLLILCTSVSAQTLKSIMESNKFIMAPVNFWTQQPYSGPFSNAVNAVVVHPEGGGGSNIFSTNYFVTTTNVFVEINTNFTSQTYYFVTNLVSVTVGAGGDTFWRTNTTIGGITNVVGPVWVGGYGSQPQIVNEFWLGTNGIPGEPWVKFDSPDWGTHFGYNTYLEFEITESGSLDGQMFWIENFPGEFQGQATFGSADVYSTNMFQVVTDTNGIPAFEVGLYSVASYVRINNNLTVKDVQTNLNLAGTGWRFALVDDNGRFRAGLGTNALSGLGGTHYWFTNVNGDLTNSVGDVVVENGGFQVSNQQTNTQQAGTGVRIAVFDPNGKLYAGFATNAIGSTNVGGSGFVLEYTNSSPITEGVFPTTSNSPSIAYKRGGLGTTFTWNTVTFTWE